MKKKSSMYAAALAGALVLGLLLAGCEHGAGPISSGPELQTVADNPASGVMSKETADNVFSWSAVTGGARIDKFKSAAALGTYLNTGGTEVAASVKYSLAAALAQGTAEKTFRISEIAGLPVVSIADEAFKPDPVNNGADDISNAVDVFVLPETITQLGTNLFADVAMAVTVAIPPVVVQVALGASTNDTNALHEALGGDVAIAVAKEADVEPEKTIPPSNPSVNSVSTSWNGDTLTVTLGYTGGNVNSASFGSGWTKGGNNNTATYSGGTDVSPVTLAYILNGGNEKKLQVTLANGELERGSGATYQFWGFDAANNAVGLKAATISETGEKETVAANGASAVWRYLPADTRIKGIFDAIYAPNAPGSTDGFVDGENGKTAIKYDDDIAQKVLRLFYVTLGANSSDDKVYISGTDLPANPTDAPDGSKLIIIDVGRPGAINSLPTFYIPHQKLGAQNGSYPYIRFRVNSGASAVILADNTGFNGTNSVVDGYFNGGTVEVMAGGKLRDGAYQGFPLGANAVILNRTGSYLATGPESTFKTTDQYEWWAGWLIGPEASGDNLPRIAWDSGNAAGKYIEVRPGKLAIDANVTVRKVVAIIYDVWFVGNTTVTIDVTDDTLTFNDDEEDRIGLKVNDTDSKKYKFYGNTGASIVVKEGNSIDTNALTANTSSTAAAFFGADEEDTTITPVTTNSTKLGWYVEQGSGISGYNEWEGYPETENEE